MENPGETKLWLTPSQKGRWVGREKERLRERGGERKQRENKKKQPSVHQLVTGVGRYADWYGCHSASMQRNAGSRGHTVEEGCSSLPRLLYIVHPRVPKAVVYAISIG